MKNIFFVFHRNRCWMKNIISIKVMGKSCIIVYAYNNITKVTNDEVHLHYIAVLDGKLYLCMSTIYTYTYVNDICFCV